MSPIHFDRVKPGDLITATFINSILDEIEHLQDQVDSMAGGSSDAPVITALIPAANVPSGSDLQIIGRNFATPAYLNTVILDTYPATGFLPGSSDTVLRVTVPPNLPGLPRPMTLTVSTTKGSAHAGITVVPPAPNVGGHPLISNATSGQGVINVGSTYTLTFQLDGQQLAIPEQFTLSTLYTNASPAGAEAQWQASTALSTPGDAQITLSPGERRLVPVRVTVPAGAIAANIALQAVSQHNSPASDAKSVALTLTVGQPAPNNDAGVAMVIGEIGPLAPLRTATIDGVTGLQVKYGANPAVPIKATMQSAGSYAFAVSVADGGALWVVGSVSGSPVAAAAATEHDIAFNLRLTATQPQNEKRILTVTATRTDGSAAGTTSTISFPITGAAF